MSVDIRMYLMEPPGPSFSLTDMEKTLWPKFQYPSVNLADYPIKHEVLGSDVFIDEPLHEGHSVVVSAKFTNKMTGQVLFEGSWPVPQPSTQGYTTFKAYAMFSWIGTVEGELDGPMTVQMDVHVSGSPVKTKSLRAFKTVYGKPGPPPEPPPEPNWWDQIISFDDAGALHIGPKLISIERLQSWLEGNVYGEKASKTVKAIFYTILGLVSIAVLFKILQKFSSTAVTKLESEIAKDAPGKLQGLFLKYFTHAKVDAKIAANPSASVLKKVFGTINPLRDMKRFIVAIAGVDILTSWLASDNIVTGTTFPLNRLKTLVEEGTVTKEDALKEIENIQAWKDHATTFINISTIVNPLLWLFRKTYMSNTELAQTNIDQIRLQIEAIIPPTPPVPPIEPPVEPEEPEPEPGDEEPDPDKPVVPGKAYITLVSNPGGASIYIDGKSTFTVTPFVHLLDAGTHNIQLQLFRYKPVFESVTIETGKSIIKTYSLIPLEPTEPDKPFIPVPIEIPLVKPPLVVIKPNAWEYTITARDADTGQILNAKIIIDGIYTGKYTTNAIILEPNATYLLRLEAFGYLPGEIIITTEALPE